MTKTPRLRHFDVRPLGSGGSPVHAPSAAGLPDVRHRAGSDQAHTDAAARFVLFELLPVLRD